MGKQDQEQDDKPKKAFQIKMTIWDDGAVDCDIREYRKLGTGRGAPSLCGPLMPDEFMRALNGYGVNSAGVSSTIKCELALDAVNKIKLSSNSSKEIIDAPSAKVVSQSEEPETTPQNDDFGLPEGLDFEGIDIEGESK